MEGHHRSAAAVKPKGETGAQRPLLRTVAQRFSVQRQIEALIPVVSREHRLSQVGIAIANRTHAAVFGIFEVDRHDTRPMVGIVDFVAIDVQIYNGVVDMPRDDAAAIVATAIIG